MCTGYPLIAKAGLGAVGALAGWANRDKLKKGFIRAFRRHFFLKIFKKY